MTGIPENENEKTDEVVLDMARNQLKAANDASDIDRSHRIPGGPVRRNTDRPRNIIVKFTTYNARRRVLEKKSSLKGGNNRIYINEHLTKARSELYYGYVPIVRQPIGSTAHWFDSPLVRQPIGSAAHWSNNPLVRQPILIDNLCCTAYCDSKYPKKVALLAIGFLSLYKLISSSHIYKHMLAYLSPSRELSASLTVSPITQRRAHIYNNYI